MSDWQEDPGWVRAGQGELEGWVTQDRIGINQIVGITSFKQCALSDDGCRTNALNILLKESLEQATLEYIVTTGDAQSCW